MPSKDSLRSQGAFGRIPGQERWINERRSGVNNKARRPPKSHFSATCPTWFVFGRMLGGFFDDSTGDMVAAEHHEVAYGPALSDLMRGKRDPEVIVHPDDELHDTH